MVSLIDYLEERRLTGKHKIWNGPQEPALSKEDLETIMERVSERCRGLHIGKSYKINLIYEEIFKFMKE